MYQSTDGGSGGNKSPADSPNGRNRVSSPVFGFRVELLEKNPVFRGPVLRQIDRRAIPNRRLIVRDSKTLIEKPFQFPITNGRLPMALGGALYRWERESPAGADVAGFFDSSPSPSS